MLTQMLHALTFFFTRLMAFFKGLSSNQTINGFKASRFFININTFDTLATINFQKCINSASEHHVLVDFDVVAYQCTIHTHTG